jgi:hypothetical protein
VRNYIISNILSPKGTSNPLKVDYDKIMSVVFKLRKWIDKKTKEVLSQEQKFVMKEFVNGESFFISWKIL